MCTCVTKITIIWCMLPEIWSATDIFLVILGHFLPFYYWPQKLKFGEKKPGATILLYICTINGDHMMSALILAVFHVGGHFWMLENQHPKKTTTIFPIKLYSLIAHAHYFTIFIYLATWRAAKLGIFTHFMFTNLPQCSQSINSLIYVYSIQILSCFLWVLDHSCDHYSSYYCCPKKISVLAPLMYGSWDIRHNNRQSFLLIWDIFCPLTSYQPKKFWKKSLEISSF